MQWEVCVKPIVANQYGLCKPRLPYQKIFGGAVALTEDHFRKTRGFSNRFFGWGGEDDDMYLRLTWANLRIRRPEGGVARYAMLKHGRDTGNEINPAR